MSDEHKEPNSQAAHESKAPEAKPIRKSTLLVLAITAAIVAVLIVITGIVPRVRARKTLRTDTNELAPPTVTVTKPELAGPSQEIVLPSNIQAFMDAPIYARTSGYIKSWNYDIGARVKKGALLAVIESPEVDQQLSQGRADLQTTQANAKLADVTAARYTDLLKLDSVSKQDTDNAVQNSAAQHASVQSQQANVQRLEELVSFERVYAPFDGVVTLRNTDVGHLVNAGNGGQLLFQVSAINTLRVFVSVPQQNAVDCKPGSSAYLTLAEFPGRKFEGKIARTANAIDPASRTLNVEVDLQNKTGELLPGAYAQVHIPTKSGAESYLLPVQALMFRSEGLRVATVVSGNKAKLVQVVPGRDYGTRIEIISGLDANSEVITNPPDSVTDGITVRVVQPDADKNKQAGAASQQGGGSSQNQGGLSGTPSQNQNTAPSQNQQEKK
jgi:RND family efflux transporter MFP subunit